MELNFYLAQLSSIIAWILLIISYWKNKDDKLLYLQVISCFFFIIDYVLLGAYSGLFVVLFEVVRDSLYIKCKDDKWVFIGCLPIYLIISIFSYTGILSLFSIFASLNDGYALMYKGKKVVTLGIVTYVLWIIYDVFCQSYVNAFIEVLVVISNITILIRGKSIFARSDKLIFTRGIDFNKKIVNSIYKLDRDNYADKFIWSREKILSIIKRKKTDYIFIYDKNKIVGYVNFIRITKEKYDNLITSKRFLNITSSDIKSFRRNTNNYVCIESISINPDYQNEKTIKSISNSITSYFDSRSKNGYNIPEIICIPCNEFEKKVLESCNYQKITNGNLEIYIKCC